MRGDVINELSKYGTELWELIEHKPVISLNRGRTSVAFTPNGHHQTSFLRMCTSIFSFFPSRV